MMKFGGMSPRSYYPVGELTHIYGEILSGIMKFL